MPSNETNNGMNEDVIADMDWLERMARCHMRAGNQSGYWDESPASKEKYQTWMAWFWYPMWELLHPFVEPPPGMPTRRAICSNGQHVAVPTMLDGLGTTLSVSRNTGESDFDYSGRLLAA